MVTVETYIDVGNILWIFYDCLSSLVMLNSWWGPLMPPCAAMRFQGGALHGFAFELLSQ